MKKLLVLACALLAVGPWVAAGSTYYPYSTYNYYGNYSYLPVQGGYGCVNLSSDLSFGSRSSEVSTLQQFLATQNVPGVGSWMVTGYYGRATEAAVRNFQASAGLLQTGIVDWATRNAIRERSCGNYGYPGGTYGYGQYSYPQYNYQYPYTYPGYPYGYAIPLRVDSLSISSAVAGTSVTLYGSGFDVTYNTVRFGPSSAYGAGSSNGTSLTVTVPNIPPGVYSITVTNSRGTSNSISFTVVGSPYQYYGYNYGYNYNYGYTYPYTYNYGYPYQYNYNYGCSNYPYCY